MSLDARIAELESEIEARRPRLGVACGKLVEAVAAGLEVFWPDYVARCIERARHEIAAMPDRRMRALKADVDEIVAHPRQVAERELVEEKSASWPHLAKLEDLVSGREIGYGRRFQWVRLSAGPGRQIPEDFAEAMAFAAGAPVAPLKAADLPLAEESNWLPKPTAAIDWTAEMHRALREYAIEACELLDVAQSLREARVEHEKAGALDRWNSA